MSPSHTIALIACALAAFGWGSMQWQTRHNVVTVGFWADPALTYDVPYLARRGGPLTPDEQRRLMMVARDELHRAFEGFSVRVSDRPDAFYRVRVAQILTWRRVAVSGQSNVFGPLGGVGAVSFETLASQAVARAPEGVTRDGLVDAIGRGLGRAAVHEFAHLLLPHVPIHATNDGHSYEYWNSNRAAQYYGPMRWDVARPHLLRRLSR
jgi:hypothetical protein